MFGTAFAFGIIPPTMAFIAGFVFFLTFMDDKEAWNKNIRFFQENLLRPVTLFFILSLGGAQLAYLLGFIMWFAICLAMLAPMAFVLGALSTIMFDKDKHE
jgi:hypothetical protein